jgi:hypothetical protein
MAWHDLAVPEPSLEAVVARRAEPLTAPVDGELVMLEPGSSRYFGLDAIGNRIWELIEHPRSLGDLCDTLQTEFEVTGETCRADVLAFVRQLEEAELVEIR